MKANELRIGNYLKWKDESQIAQIRYILKEAIGLEDDIPSDLATDLDFFEPIPLTEEWLLKFGFRESNKYLVKYRLGLKKRGDNYFYDNISIQYVHSLQNLYFALTDEELTIKT